MIRSFLILPAAALATVATLGLASAASFEHTGGTIVSVDRGAQSLKLLDGSTFHFETPGEMRNLYPGATIEIAYANGGTRNLVADYRVQNRR